MLFSLAVALGVLMPTLPAAMAAGTLTIDVSTNASAPPSTLGPYTMQAFPTNPQSEGATVTSVATPIGGTIGFSYGLIHDLVPTD